MMKCTNCFKDTADDSKICGECKKKIVNIVTAKDGCKLGIVPASQGRKLGNYFVDTIVYLVFMLIIGFIEGLVFVIFKLSNELIKPVSYITAFVGFLAYYIILEAIFGKTVGKMVTKTRVVTEVGIKASVAQVVIRSFSRFIPFEYLSMVVGINPVGWHDSLAKTYVVREKPFK